MDSQTGNTCWFCRTNPAQERSSLFKQLYRVKSPPGARRLVYDIMEIEILRCSTCAGIQNRINAFSGLYVILLLALTIVAGVLGYRLELQLDIYNLSIYLGLGAFAVGLLLMFPYIKLMKARVGGARPHWATLPEIREWLAKGWTVGAPAQK